MDVCDLLSLSVGDLDKMRIEFPDVYEELFTDGKGRLKEELKKKTDRLADTERDLEKQNLKVIELEKELKEKENNFLGLYLENSS